MSDLERGVRLVGEDIAFIIRLIAGFVLIIVGTIGLLFPIAPDWLLILVGIAMFDTHGKFRRRLLKHIPEEWREKIESVVLYDIKKREKPRI